MAVTVTGGGFSCDILWWTVSWWIETVIVLYFTHALTEWIVGTYHNPGSVPASDLIESYFVKTNLFRDFPVKEVFSFAINIWYIMQ